MTALWSGDGVSTLDLRNRGLTDIPGIERCLALERLWLAGNRLEALPAALGALPALVILSVADNPLASIDETLASRLRLKEIDLSSTQLGTLPQAVARWPLRSVRMAKMRDDFQWEEALSRIDPSAVVSLTLGENRSLARLPDSLAKFGQLKVLHLNDCAIEELPDWLGELRQLETLSLFRNALSSLPEAVAALPALRSLVIGGNPGTRRIKAELRKRAVSYAVT